MHQRVAELILRDERAVGRGGEHEDVQPARVIGDQQGMRLDLPPSQLNADSDDPGRRRQEPPWPRRTAQQRFRDDMNRRQEQEQQDQPGDARRGARRHLGRLLSDRG